MGTALPKRDGSIGSEVISLGAGATPVEVCTLAEEAGGKDSSVNGSVCPKPPSETVAPTTCTSCGVWFGGRTELGTEGCRRN